jgi:hypothetical protein
MNYALMIVLEDLMLAARGAGAAAAAASAQVVPAAGLLRDRSDLHPGVRVNALIAAADWLSGDAKSCPHRPTAKRMQPVVAVEGLAVCPRCTHLLPDGPCDGCGRGRDDLHVLDIPMGPLTFRAHVCDRCRDWDPSHG